MKLFWTEEVLSADGAHLRRLGDHNLQSARIGAICGPARMRMIEPVEQRFAWVIAKATLQSLIDHYLPE